MSEPIVYRSVVRLERVGKGVRRAYLPGETEPVLFGVHDEIARHYGRQPGTYEPHAATLDYLVAATSG